MLPRLVLILLNVVCLRMLQLTYVLLFFFAFIIFFLELFFLYVCVCVCVCFFSFFFFYRSIFTAGWSDFSYDELLRKTRRRTTELVERPSSRPWEEVLGNGKKECPIWRGTSLTQGVLWSSWRSYQEEEAWTWWEWSKDNCLGGKI